MTEQPIRGPAYGLVRDKHGKPKFADINHIPAPLWAMLTDDEKRDIQEKRKNGSHTSHP